MGVPYVGCELVEIGLVITPLLLRHDRCGLIRVSVPLVRPISSFLIFRNVTLKSVEPFLTTDENYSTKVMIVHIFEWIEKTHVCNSRLII